MKLKEEYRLSKSFDLTEYDQYMRQQPLEQRMMLDVIITKCKDHQKIKILEFGAGTGRFTKLILQLFPNIDLTLVEPDKHCCVKLKGITKNSRNITLRQCLAEDFASDTRFDIIVMATAFHHVRFENQALLLKNIRNLLSVDGVFLLGDNFLADYRTLKEREVVLRKSIDKWIRESKDEKERKMALKMKSIVFQEDFGGEYFLCPTLFESSVKKAKLHIKGKVNVTNTDPLDLENYFYLITNRP